MSVSNVMVIIYEYGVWTTFTFFRLFQLLPCLFDLLAVFCFCFSFGSICLGTT